MTRNENNHQKAEPLVAAETPPLTGRFCALLLQFTLPTLDRLGDLLFDPGLEVLARLLRLGDCRRDRHQNFFGEPVGDILTRAHGVVLIIPLSLCWPTQP